MTLSLALQAERAADAATDALASEDSDEHCIATLATLYRAQAKLMQAVLDAGETRLDARSLSNLRTIFGAQIERVTQYSSDDAALVDSRPCVYLSIDLARELATGMTRMLRG